ncbi:hypothetical protein LCGC14_2182610 [marine sediment metagenome]|uniref:Uncharacterized protein n=1 Tax=marine sediment metagenome TaxID=412755 RepID=A0A0F9E8W8_9ZZZZ
MKKFLLAIGAVMMLSTPAMAKIMCITKTQMMCNEDLGCEVINPVVWRVLDIENEQIHRCDNVGCDAIDIFHTNKSEDNGTTYLNFSFGGGAVLRMDSKTYKFVEMATWGLSSYISHGQCTLGE